ncbi:putative Endonuclease/exonuclease/phosphatase superfamily [Helianthus annuus]|nr:putative Endonuclease/exonuclease/phosphatase superfamily [Helianthus annuus]
MKKKDKEGRIFGFVSFRGVRDMEGLKVSLSKVKLGGNKLLVNVALFAKENENLNPSGKFGGREKGSGEGYARPQGVLPKGYGAQHVKKGISFLDILTNRSHADKEEDVVIVDPGISSLSNLSGKALVGRAPGVYELRSVKSSLLLAGYAGAVVQYLGGLSVLISFDDGELSKKLLEEKEVWCRWFDKKFKVWVVEENDQWIPDFLEEDDNSADASSELGGGSAFPADDVFVGEEDGGLADDDLVEDIEQRKDNQGSLGDMQIPMQKVTKDGGYAPNEISGRLFNNGEQLISNSHVCLIRPQVGIVDPGPSFLFNIGKSNSNKSSKVRSALFNKKDRPNISIAGDGLINKEFRPKKRSRTFMEGNGKGRQVRSEVIEGADSDKGFEELCFDLNKLSSAGNVVAEQSEGDPVIVEQVSNREEGGGDVEGNKATSEVEKEIMETVAVGSKIGIDIIGHSELLRTSMVSGLIEYNMSGQKFTYCSDFGNKLSKLDRFLVNPDFFNAWPTACCRVLPRLWSDHNPILLKCQALNFGPRPFRVFNSWFGKQGFDEVVKKAVSDFIPSDIHPDVSFIKKLSFIRDRLRTWKVDMKRKEGEEVEAAKSEIDVLEASLDTSDFTEEEEWIYYENKKIIREAEESKVMDLRQRSRIKWAKEGDENSKFFHSMINSRKASNSIHGIEVNGVWISKPTLVKKEVFRFFRDKFVEDCDDRPRLVVLN